VRRLVLCSSTCGLGGCRGASKRSPPSSIRGVPAPRRTSSTSRPGSSAEWRAGSRGASSGVTSRLGRPRHPTHVVAGGGHLILLDQPEVVAPVVREFLLDSDTLAAPRRRAAWEQLTARCR
jgi:hypothetical protein